MLASLNYIDTSEEGVITSKRISASTFERGNRNISNITAARCWYDCVCVYEVKAKSAGGNKEIKSKMYTLSAESGNVSDAIFT